jgi:NAD(P)-dependent dehydrogenase (short-subunit alcohol dehydrogenase family)
MKSLHSVIIGGTKGVGRELALLFASVGQRITVVGRTAAEIPEFPDQRIEGVVGDAENAKSLLGMLIRQIDKRGKVSSLVFLQRYRGNGDSWAGELAVSLTATKTILEGLVPYFSPEGNRSICIVTSNACSFVACNQSVGYHAAKAALRQMARFYAVKLGSLGLRVNVVAPCTFVKPESSTYYDSQHELQALYKKITPLGRMGTAEEVARTVAFLCGPEASFITGQELTVDGGLSLLLQDTLAREVAGITA